MKTPPPNPTSSTAAGSGPDDLAAARALEQRAWSALQRGEPRQALHTCQQLGQRYPGYAAGWYSISQICLRLNNAGAALAATERLLQLEADHPRALLQKANCLLRLGRDGEARPLVLALDQAPLSTAYQHATLALLQSRLDLQQQALAHYAKAAALEPEVAEHYYNLATVHRFLGNIDAADDALAHCLARAPLDAEAHKLRADLRRQNTSSHHLDALDSALQQCANQPRQQATLYYAKAKELEDLAQWDAAFEALTQGARLRRERMRYSVDDDVDTMACIRKVYREPPPAPPAGAPQSTHQSAPIFVIGLPRTGTTLVERILGMHSAVHAAGELNQFATCMSRAVAEGVARQGGQPGRLSKQQRVQLSAQLDFAALGRAYLAALPPAANAAPRFTDKMPLNFLYAGLIHRALPAATIVHVQRHPMDACYAMYKTLFADAYPFSYRLDELAQYYLAYRELMAHWQATLPGVIHTVQYEALVNAFEPTTRALLAACGLDWESACLDFHTSGAASTTASASQVREPVHNRSVGLWRRYERQLQPLADQLQAAGVPL
ncbi:tetratricopeptide repeat-containing sulfotransferase family protein [Parahaliea mediterranea]|uniref:tetratricopeptide repeat-containing sulfotransferase family protein n=1 Tax=Parahaliea mediterranea TaxID=651086 RepID=UPI000E2E6AAA|nr:sulfotransferase [Parahaliea mediterranea]